MSFTPILGLDADEDLSPRAVAIKAAGFGYVMNYARFLTKAMVDKYHAAGLLVGVIDEKSSTRALQGALAGKEDGEAAVAIMQRLGAPPTAGIAATVDDDVSTVEQTSEVDAYFAAYDGAFWPDALSPPLFTMMGYADGTALSVLRQHGLPICWLAGAGGWSGSHAFALAGKPQLIQGPTIGPAGGSWTPAGTMAPIKCPALGFQYDPDIAMAPLEECGLF